MKRKLKINRNSRQKGKKERNNKFKRTKMSKIVIKRIVKKN